MHIRITKLDLLDSTDRSTLDPLKKDISYALITYTKRTAIDHTGS